jgi:hypothetical protein
LYDSPTFLDLLAVHQVKADVVGKDMVAALTLVVGLVSVEVSELAA